jgi:hypothetical protein
LVWLLAWLMGHGEALGLRSQGGPDAEPGAEAV